MVNRITFKRSCYACGTDRTSHNKHGSENWYSNKPTKLYLCTNCNRGLIRRYEPNFYEHSKKYIESRTKRNKKRLAFMGKYIMLDHNPRKYICSVCGKTEGKMDIHHIQYHKDDPLKDTIELCCSCHSKETWKTRLVS